MRSISSRFISVFRRVARSTLVIAIAGALVISAPAQAQQNNNVEAQCTANGSSTTFYLCQDGNSCGRIVTAGPAPFSSGTQDRTISISSAWLTERLRLLAISWCGKIHISTGQSTITFADVQSNPARGEIVDTTNASTSFSVSTSSPAGPFSITKTNSVNSTRHNINLLQPSQYDDPKPDYNFLKYTVTCTKTPKTGALKIIKVAQGGDATFDIVATPVSGTAVGYQIGHEQRPGRADQERTDRRLYDQRRRLRAGNSSPSRVEPGEQRRR